MKIHLWLLLSCCCFCFNPAAAASDFSVVVSIRPIHSIVTGLMKDIAQPELLIDGDDTPYSYQPDSQDRQVLADASLVIWVGAELEQSLQPEVGRLESGKIVELLSSQRMKILPSRQEPDRRDPFFWMDDRNMLILIDELTDLFIRVDPARAHVYSRNRRHMIPPLQRIDKEYEYGYRGLKAGLGAMYFDVLQYFEQAYALKTVAQVSASPRHPVQAVSLLRVRDVIASGKVNCLLVDTSMPAKNLELLLQGQDVGIGRLDVFGTGFETGMDLYLQLMDYNTDEIKRCLQADMRSAAAARQSAMRNSIANTAGLEAKFILSDHRGESFSELDLQGSYSLLYFGYTHCPDICPTGLSVLTQALTQLNDKADRVQPVFITVDPERDSIPVMRQYVSYFHPRLIGLTGSDSMIRRVAGQLGVRYEKAPADIAYPQEYAVDHSAGLFLLAPDGSFVTRFAQTITADNLAAELLAIIR